MKKCTKCVLPANFPGITFNDDGVCNYCLSYVPLRILGEDSLATLLDSIRGKGRKYDCLVLVSGGRDSSFVLYKVCKEFGMRTLALNYDSGFASEQAKINLRRITASLKVPLFVARSKRDFQKQSLKRNIIAWARNPSSELAPTLCFGCEEGFLGNAYATATRLRIPLIISGRSGMEDSIFKKALFRYHSSPFVHRFIKIAKNPFYIDPRNLYHYLSCYVESPMLITHKRSVIKINLFDYVEYDEKQMILTLSSLGWEKHPNLSSTWRFDCEIHAIVDHIFYRKLGFSEREELYSQMIREGKIDRPTALKRIQNERKEKKAQVQIMNEVFAKLGLSKKEMDQILFC
jgi:hypothetical protein